MQKLKELFKIVSSSYQTINLEYRVVPKPKFGPQSRIYGRIKKIVEANRAIYLENLDFAVGLKESIQSIKKEGEENDSTQPTWNNGFLPGLDIISLYTQIVKNHPKKYIEIGSGNSTKVVRKAIGTHNLVTKIVSIDPFPRAEIDTLSDEIVRKPFEDLKNYDFIVNDLNEGDILFIDNSHRVFPNSDAAVCFLELLPFLKKGVIVHIHDIYLPFDYPQFMCDRFYNEQYMLAAFIVSNPQRYSPILPNYFVSEDLELAGIIESIWDHSNLAGVERHGGSFWFKIS